MRSAVRARVAPPDVSVALPSTRWSALTGTSWYPVCVEGVPDRLGGEADLGAHRLERATLGVEARGPLNFGVRQLPAIPKRDAQSLQHDRHGLAVDAELSRQVSGSRSCLMCQG